MSQFADFKALRGLFEGNGLGSKEENRSGEKQGRSAEKQGQAGKSRRPAADRGIREKVQIGGQEGSAQGEGACKERQDGKLRQGITVRGNYGKGIEIQGENRLQSP